LDINTEATDVHTLTAMSTFFICASNLNNALIIQQKAEV